MTPGPRRAIAILSVLLVVTIGALIGASMMRSTDAQHALIDASLRRTQSRALAWSGVQAAMSEMAQQREELLDGAAPDLTEQWDLFTLPDGRRAAVRLLPIGRAGEVGVSEAAKLNVNTATTEMLALVPGLNETTAAAIVARRGAGPIPSVESLVDLDGLSVEAIYGLGADGPSADDAPALLDVLTALSADPSIQAGEGDGGEAYRGDRRINVNAEWSEDLGAAIARRYDQGLADAVEDLMKGDTDFGSESKIVGFCLDNNMDPEELVEVLDVFCASPDPYILGRVDLLTAPVEVLAAIPGLDDTTARAIVQTRDGLDPVSRRTVVWPLIEGVVTSEQFEEAVGYLASRSLQWRVRIEAGTLRDEPAARVAPSEDRGDRRTDMIGGSFRGADEPVEGETLEDRIVLDAVIDVSSRRPRLAYLRDVTNLDLSLEMRRLTEVEEDTMFDDPLAPASDPADEADLATSDEAQDPYNLADAAEFDPFEAADGTEADPDQDAPEPTDLGEGVAPGADEPPDAGAEPDEGVDRRVGRWTGGGGR